MGPPAGEHRGVPMRLAATLFLVGAALGCSAIDYGIPRVNGECYGQCTGDRVCNRDNGLCELNPCSAGCGEGRHCEASGAVPHCAPDGKKFSIAAEPKA